MYLLLLITTTSIKLVYLRFDVLTAYTNKSEIIKNKI
jgi:hypothetical protein